MRRTVKDRTYAKEELQILLQDSRMRTRALILLLASMGMRIGAVSELCIKHMKKYKCEGKHLYQFTIYENSNGVQKQMYSSECAQEIDRYLDFRRHFGEAIDGQSRLFRDEFKSDGPKAASKPEIDPQKPQSAIRKDTRTHRNKRQDVKQAT